MTRTLTLTPRLAAAARRVPQGARLADIGTDHAYLPAWLLQNGRICHAIAADVRRGPLNRAQETAAFYHLADQMEFRLCDGLSGIAPDEADTVVIAGMGGETIISILGAAPWTRSGGYSLILQPMSGQDDLRRWLSENGYSLEEEHLAREGNTLYNIMLAKGGTMPPLSEREYLTGCFSMEEPELGAYLSGHLERLSRRIEGLKKSRQEVVQAQCVRLEQLYAEIELTKKEWEQCRR